MTNDGHDEAIRIQPSKEKSAEDSWKDSDFLMFDAEPDVDNSKEDKNNKNESEASQTRKRPRLEDNNRGRGRPPPFRSLTSVTYLPPWMDRPHSHKFHRNVPKLVLLHDEIVNFAKLMAPQPHELKVRQDLVAKVANLIEKTFGGKEKCTIDVFGSQATGLLLPTSDVDLVITLPEYNNDPGGNSTDKSLDDEKKGSNNGEKGAKKKINSETEVTCEDDTSVDELSEKQREQREMEEFSIHDTSQHISPLARLGNALRMDPEWKDQLSYLEVVENTRVPIVKFTHASTDISVDICINQEHGRNAAELMKRFLDAMPPLKPLTFVLKYFMAARGLNEPYSGGCGSYMLQLMIVSFLQHRERHSYNYRIANTMNLGSLLVEFFELYGMDFNYLTTGISVRSDGFYFPKGSKGKLEIFHQPSRPFSLAMENPLDITMDVGRPSFRMQLIQKSFEISLRVLLSHVAEPAIETESILAAILPTTEEMETRSKMLKLNSIEKQSKLDGKRNVDESENEDSSDDQDAKDMFCSDSESSESDTST